MNITAKHYKKILKIIERLHEHIDEHQMRTDIAEPLLDLLDADYFASFCWNPHKRCYVNGAYLNMDDSNIDQYSDYFQFRDPITFRLAQKRVATTVSEIMPHADLMKTEFFNDFLLVDGLYHGINLHLYHHQDNIGDLRIWRKKGRGDFDNSHCNIFNMLSPHLTQAIKNIRRHQQHTHDVGLSIDDQCLALKHRYNLTDREGNVTRLLLNGSKDLHISQTLSISITTVRTHIKNIFRKVGITSRYELHSILHQDNKIHVQAPTSVIAP